jgi:hypothetical protein
MARGRQSGNALACSGTAALPDDSCYGAELYVQLALANTETKRNTMSGGERWSRLSEQLFRVDKWSLCRG